MVFQVFDAHNLNSLSDTCVQCKVMPLQAMQPSAADLILEWLLTEFKSPQDRAAQLPDAFEASAYEDLDAEVRPPAWDGTERSCCK